MSQRFFEYFFADEPMTELSEAQALAKGTYVTEVEADGIRHLQSYADNELDLIIYPDATPSDAIVRVQRARYPNVKSWIVSPTTREGDVKRRTVWSYAGDGSLDRKSEYVFEPRTTSETWFYGDGRYGGKLERRYDEHDEEIEVREHLADGRVLVHD